MTTDRLKKVISITIPADLLDWLDGYTKSNRLPRSLIIHLALLKFKESSERKQAISEVAKIQDTRRFADGERPSRRRRVRD